MKNVTNPWLWWRCAARIWTSKINQFLCRGLRNHKTHSYTEWIMPLNKQSIHKSFSTLATIASKWNYLKRFKEPHTMHASRSDHCQSSDHLIQTIYPQEAELSVSPGLPGLLWFRIIILKIRFHYLCERDQNSFLCLSWIIKSGPALAASGDWSNNFCSKTKFLPLHIFISSRVVWC